jgi:hypothetical protein
MDNHFKKTTFKTKYYKKNGVFVIMELVLIALSIINVGIKFHVEISPIYNKTTNLYINHVMIV